MAESARHRAEQVFGPRPVRQWLLSFPFRPLRGNARVARRAASPLRGSLGPLRFLFASKPDAIGPVLGIVHRVIAGCWRIKRASSGAQRSAVQCSAVRRGDADPALRQRAQLDKFAGSEFEQPKAGPKGEGQDARSSVHFHILWLDGVYEPAATRPDKPRLHRARAPTSAQFTHLAEKIAHRVCRHLTRSGWLEGEDESAFLSDRAGCDDGLDALRMSSITYRIATGKHAGRKIATLQTIPADNGSSEGDAGKVGGFSLHAGAAAEAHESHKLERLCRSMVRPAISEKRLSLSPQGTALPTQDAVEERHDGRGVRAGGLHL